MNRILLVEDDPKMRQLVSSDLKMEGFQVETAADGVTGLEKAETGHWDVIILDVMLPKMSGYDVCRQLRGRQIKTPILMLTAKAQDTDKVVGLQIGADDYLTKPFSVLELTARLQALIRRSSGNVVPQPEYISGPWRIDVNRQEAFRGKQSISLTSKEFQILDYFLRHRGEVISREQFLRDLWKFESEMPTTRTVDNQVSSLRRKLGWTEDNTGPRILTVHQSGYRFVD